MSCFRLDSYLFRRNGRKPTDRGSKNAHPPILKENCRLKADDIPPICTSISISGEIKNNVNTEDLICTESSLGFKETPSCTMKNRLSPERKENSLCEVKTERIIKEVPKKRKVIDYSDLKEGKPVDEATSDRKVLEPKLSVFERLRQQRSANLPSNETMGEATSDRKMLQPKLSVFERLGQQRGTTLPSDETAKTSANLILHAKEISESNLEGTISKSNEKKDVSLQAPFTESSNLSDPKPKIEEKTSKQVEPVHPLVPGEVNTPLLSPLKGKPGTKVEKVPELLQGQIMEEVAVCEPLRASSQPFLVSNEHAVFPEEHVPFQPPLPQGDPMPPPPLPSSTPPPTPVKGLLHGDLKSNLKSETYHHQDTASSSLLILQGDLSECNKSNSNAGVASEKPKECEKTNKPRWSDENLHMQCPFKPRRRAKSVVVVEDPVDKDKKNILNSIEPLKVETSSRTSKSSDKFKRTPLKKSENQENRLSSDRLHQTQRSVHSNRHLSLKSYVHLPERRSPSELLNGRSGRIARISHQDKVRVRIHDRRSRSLSPQKRRLKEDEHRTKFVQRAPTTRERSRRNGTEDCSGKIDKSQDEKKSKPSKKKSVIPKEDVHKVKQKMAELFGESSPEPEEKSLKNVNGNLRSDQLISTAPVELIPKKEGTSLPTASLKSSMNIGASVSPSPANNIHPQGNIIVIKRRPRSSIKLGNSEDAAPRTRILTVQSSMQDSLKCSILVSKEDNSASDFQKNSKPGESAEQHPKSTVAVHPVETPLYFRERGVKRGTSDDSMPDEDLIGESEESLTNADSDDNYNPKLSLRSSSKRKGAKRKK